MREAKCEKCGKYLYVENHHILPQSLFGNKTETKQLCSSCHTDYHQKIGAKALKNKSVEFHYEQFYRWLASLSIVLLLMIGVGAMLNY